MRVDASVGDRATVSVPHVLRPESGVPFHVQIAEQAGASRDEVVSSRLIGLPAAGLGVTHVLPAAIAAYDARRRHAGRRGQVGR